MFDKLDDILFRLEEVLNQLNEPGVANDPGLFQKLMKEQAELQPIADAYQEYKNCKQTIGSSCLIPFPKRLPIPAAIITSVVSFMTLPPALFYIFFTFRNAFENSFLQYSSRAGRFYLFQPSCSCILLSFAAWSAAIRLSMISSRSPSMILFSLYKVSLILWSVTRPCGKL